MKSLLVYMREEWIFAVILLFVFFCATYRLTEVPPTWFDEGIYIQVASSLEHHGVQQIQTAPSHFEGTGHVTIGYPVAAPVALSMAIFGDSLFAARVPMALFIMLCVAAGFALIYRLYGLRTAALSLLFLSTLPLLYGNGKNVLGEVPGLFYTLAALYFVRIPFVKKPKHSEPAQRTSLFSGLKLVASDPTLLSVLLMVAVCGLFAWPMLTFIPVLAQTVYHVGARGFSQSLSAFGAGALVAASAALYPLHVAGAFYAGAAIALGAVLVFMAVRTLLDAGTIWPRLLFKYSLLYLASICVILVIDRIFA